MKTAEFSPRLGLVRTLLRVCTFSVLLWTVAMAAAEAPLREQIARWKEMLAVELRVHPDHRVAEDALDALIQYDWGALSLGDLQNALAIHQAQSENPEVLPAAHDSEPEHPPGRPIEKPGTFQAKLQYQLQDALRKPGLQAFDQALTVFSEVRAELDSPPYSDPSWQPLRKLAHEGYEFLAAFQDTLDAVQSRNSMRASESLQKIEYPGPAIDLVLPRSSYARLFPKLRAQIYELSWAGLKDPEKLQRLRQEAQGIDDLAEVETFLAKLRALAEAGTQHVAESDLMGEWVALSRLERDLKRGRVDLNFLRHTSLQSPRDEFGAIPGWRSDLRSLLFSAGLPIYLRLPPRSEPEAPIPRQLYFPKLIAEAFAEKNWNLLLQIIDVIRQLRLEDVASPLDLCGLESFVAARLYEKAGQSEFSIAMDELALSSGCQLLPLDFIRESLAGRRLRDPVTFARGEAMLLDTGPERRRHDTNRLPSP